MALLDGLDAVRWDQLSHAYGPAMDVPDLVRALVDPARASRTIKVAATRAKRSVRDQVIWTLYGNVFHQGTVWQASSKVIPFFVEILRDGPREPALLAFAIDYLHHLAFGYPRDLYPTLIDPATHFAAADATPEGPESSHDERQMAEYARDCYRGVEAALSTIAPFVRDPDDATALAAIAVLGSYRDPTAAAALRDAVAEQRGPRLATALVALSQLDAETARTAARGHLASGDRFLAIHAAAAVVLADPERATDEVIAVLTLPLGDLTEAESRLTGSVGALVSRVLSHLPERHVARAADAIARTLETAQPMTSLSATATLLRLVFGDAPAPKRASDLTAIQRRAIEAIAARGRFVVGAAVFGNYSLLLHDRGLPTTAPELRAWLGN
jgi:hypothetical protein